MSSLRHFRHLASLLLVAAGLSLTACGGGGGGGGDEPDAGGPAPVQVDTTRTARTTLDAAGGSVTATAADGRRYTLTVPAGALAAATEITATPVVSMGDAPLADGLKGAVRFGPSGLRFARPATLRIEGADPTASAGTTLVGFTRSADGSSMELGLPRVDGSAIELQVFHFSDVGVSQATPQQVAAVPPSPAANPADVMHDELARQMAQATTDAEFAAAYIRVHDTLVGGRLARARFPGLVTPTERQTAIELATAWLVFTNLVFDVSLANNALPGGLGPVVTAVQQQLLEVLSFDFEAGMAECLAAAPVGASHLRGLQAALQAAQEAFFLKETRGGLPGLDAVTVGRRLNDCVRVAFVPRDLPAFEGGRPVSLDAQAQLIFANDPNAVVPVPFAITVRSDDATIANPTGFSDAQGAYTTVVTPRASDPQFDVEACMVIGYRFGGTIGSLLCGRQTVGGAPAPVILAGRLTRTVDVSGEGFTATERGTLDLRVRAELDGSFTVLESIGQVSRSGTSDKICRPSFDASFITVTLNSRFEHTISRGVFFPAGVGFVFAGFEFFGPTTSVQEFIPNSSNDCVVQTVTRTVDDGDDFGIVRIAAIERDANGLPTAITLSDFTGNTNGSIRGRLLRE